jgi:hypothetical protein
MIPIIALGSAAFLVTVMVLCTCAGKPVTDALDEIQADEEAKR